MDIDTLKLKTVEGCIRVEQYLGHPDKAKAVENGLQIISQQLWAYRALRKGGPLVAKLLNGESLSRRESYRLLTYTAAIGQTFAFATYTTIRRAKQYLDATGTVEPRSNR